MNYSQVIDFWYLELNSDDWWKKDQELDQKIRDRFLDLHSMAVAGELFEWRSSPLGRVAEVIVIDQFSRNIFRDQKESFLYDPMALALAQEAVRAGVDEKLSLDKRQFLYLPYMHSESKIIHQEAIELYSTPGLEYNLEFERKHKAIIDRFGRYPHRNEVLGRESTQEEIDFLKEPNSSF